MLLDKAPRKRPKISYNFHIITNIVRGETLPFSVENGRNSVKEKTETRFDMLPP
jgi:hypothetical protein